MTTDFNKELVRQFVDVANARNWDRVEELVAPDFQRHTSVFGQPEVHSWAQFREFLVSECQSFPDGCETIIGIDGMAG